MSHFLKCYIHYVSIFRDLLHPDGRLLIILIIFTYSKLALEH